MFAGSDLPTEVQAREVQPPAPADSHIEGTAATLARAERPLMVIGSQALSISAEADRIATAVAQLGIPVYLSGMARGLLGREHPLQMRHARRKALRESDCVILAGVPCDFRLDYGRHIRRSATLIAANRSAREARMNRRPTLAAIGDAGLFIERLAARAIDSSKWRDWTQALRKRDLEREAEIDAQAAREGEFVNPIEFFRALDRAAGENAIMVADGGDFVATASYIVRPRAPLSWLDPGVFGTLGVGAGFALGAAVARPQSEVWIIYGDGACGYGLVEFDTFVRHRIPVIAVVGNDAAWTQIAREQVKMLRDDVSTVLARTDYHRVAEGFGAEGILVTKNAAVPAVLKQARAIARSGRPVLVNVWLDKTEFREGSISM
jgi:acetolactate synthase-1/2/3 large subunit